MRRTPAVNGVPRSRGRNALGLQAPRVAWCKPTPWPAWLTPDAWAALPETLVLREVPDDIGRPGVRTRQSTLVTTRLDTAGDPVPDLAERYRRRWQLDTSLAHLQMAMPMAVLHGQTVSGARQEWMGFAIVYHLVRLVMCQAAGLQPIAVERISFREALRWLSAPNTAIP